MEFLFTFLAGMFILVGTTISFKAKSTKFVDFSISTAFSVMFGLIVFELIPTVSESLKLYEVFLYIISGILLLKLLDVFFPHHHHDHKKDKEHHDTLKHIAIVSSIALILHNVIEGMAIYSTTMTSVHSGFMMMLGVGMHNIPMGMVIGFSLSNSNSNKVKTLLLSLFVSLSTVFGGIIMLIFNNYLISETFTAILLAVALGMIIYIALFELLPKLICTDNKKTVLLGIAFGILLIILSNLFGHHH